MAETNAELRVIIRAETADLRAAMETLRRESRTASTEAGRNFRGLAEQSRRDFGLVKNAIRELGNQAQGMAGQLGPAGAILGRLGPVGLAVGAGLGVAAAGLKTTATAAADFNQALSQLSAITGATGRDLAFLRDQAIAMGSASTLSARETLDAFRLIASAKPELMSNAEALAETTRQAHILAEASGLSLPEAASALTSALNQMRLPASESARVINVMAAGARLGTAEIPELTDAMLKSGSAARAAGVDFETFTATLELLLSFKRGAEETGTGLRNVLFKLLTGAQETNPAIVGLDKALENLAARIKQPADLLDLFDDKAAVTAQDLLTVRGELDAFRKGITGTEEAQRAARITQDNLRGDLARLGSAYETLKTVIGDLNEGALRDFIGWMGRSTRAVAEFFNTTQIEAADAKVAGLRQQLEDLRTAASSPLIGFWESNNPQAQADRAESIRRVTEELKAAKRERAEMLAGPTPTEGSGGGGGAGGGGTDATEATGRLLAVIRDAAEATRTELEKLDRERAERLAAVERDAKIEGVSAETVAQAKVAVEQWYSKERDKLLQASQAKMRAATDREQREIDALARQYEQAAVRRVEAEKSGQLAALDLERERIELQRDLGQISNDQAIAQLLELIERRRTIILQAIADERALQAGNPVALAGLEGKEGAANTGADADQFQLMASRAREIASTYKGFVGEVFGTLGSAVDRSVQGIIQGTLTTRQAMANAWQSIAASAVSASVRIVTSWIRDQIVMRTVGAITETTLTGQTVAGEATREGVKRATATKSVLMSAKEAAANAYAAMSGVPYVGPVLGAAAAAAVFAAVLAFGSFKEGGIVPNDMLALVHKDEMVLPAPISAAVQGMAAGATGGAASPPAQGPSVEASPAAGGGAVESGGRGDASTVGPPSMSLGALGAALGGGPASPGGSVVTTTGTPAVQAAPIVNTGGGASGGAGRGITPVRIVGASTTVSTRSIGGTVETTQGKPVATVPAGGAMPVEDQERIKSVMVLNSPLRVSFNAISTMLTIMQAPLGVGMALGVGFIAAFRQGGNVPADMLALLHQDEMVLPKPLAENVRTMTNPDVLPPAMLASIRQVTRAEATILRDTERRRDLETRTGGGDAYHAEIHVHAWDADTARDQLERNKDVVSDIVFRKMRHANRGAAMRGR